MAFANSVIVAVVVTASTVFFSTLAGFSFSKLSFRGRQGLYLAVIVTLAIPAQIGTIPMFIMMNEFGWIDSLLALTVPILVPHFWTGTKTEYFQLYEATARASKSIDPGLKVGGPSSSVFVPDARYDGEYHDKSVEAPTAEAPHPDALPWKPVWIHELIEYCAERDLPIDFLSTHLYPTDYAFDTQGVGHPISRNRDATMNDLRYPDAEVHITEWSTFPSSRDHMHDTVFAAT